MNQDTPSAVTGNLSTFLQDGSDRPETRGFLENGWFIETAGAVRQSLRIQKCLHKEKTPFQDIAIYETEFFGKVMTLDDVVMLTERDEFVYHEMLVHVPLCSIENPKSVLIIGGGDCGCLREVLKHDCIERVVQCDIDERVTDISEKFYPWVTEARNDKRAELLFADGVAYIEKHEGQFDLIIVDSTDPKGMALSLFLSEFYKKVRRALTPRGIMTAQTESPHWDSRMVGAIYEQLGLAFPFSTAFLANVPTYASGTWTLAFAANSERIPSQRLRSTEIGKSCRYYNEDIHNAAFALPNFTREAILGRNPFEKFDQATTETHHRN